ncbi:hypothetical protein [Moorena sp. SIO3H5]|nr:hypothetical protein [Moorena sp. SIO3H5]
MAPIKKKGSFGVGKSEVEKNPVYLITMSTAITSGDENRCDR